MKGFVPTPDATVDVMVEKLFRGAPPSAESKLLDPGSGRGAFIDGVIRYCERHRLAVPRIVAVESDPAHVAFLRSRFRDSDRVVVRQSDFLTAPIESYDYIIGNPPYVPITGLSEQERSLYRERFATAVGRFDLYLLFFERALKSLRSGGRLVFITPEKYLYVATAAPLRRLLASAFVSELHFAPEDTFENRITYPLITTVDASPGRGELRVIHRDGSQRVVRTALPATSWLPLVRAADGTGDTPTLADVAARISCGIATGADSVFVLRKEEVPAELGPFARPTLSGRDVVDRRLPPSRHSMLVPYGPDGRLLPESELGPLGDHLRRPENHSRLVRRTCVQRKPWYAFHETPPLRHVLRPKILCKDIGARPVFVVDREGSILPRHSLYYIVPLEPAMLDELAEYLNSEVAVRWLSDHCQRAANGFLRVQSHVLKKLPLPPALHPRDSQLLLAADAERRTA